MNPYDRAHELAKEIRNSEVFRRLKDARERIEQDPSTLHMLQDFRLREWELQTKIIDGQELSQEEKDNLARLAEIVRLNRDVSEYLEAERQLTVMLMDIQDILSKVVEDALLPHPGLGDTKENE
ncbi:YlbF family regulator [Alicyclobacillus shizuokensis]|uniref:YlbF family regulator n=1 Tax=Alicyclobacillus shizuokensis TaxID=392014 RepID=UPI00082C5603|nr:YlbF family regulator [Alicyclobacillus shizuokensis]